MSGERLNSPLENQRVEARTTSAFERAPADAGQPGSGWRRGPSARSAESSGAALRTLLVILAAACSGPPSEQLSCEDVLPGGADFTSIQALVMQSPRRGGCLGAPCHSASAQSGGIRLDEPKLVYEELSSRPELFYAVLASREMPKRGRPWSNANLRAFRSWYCGGAFPP